ncbi:endo-1,4-beta-xylanase [Bradyrhizobium sp. LHD-71]|uniref:endo-1,4-beta-xylanase n=1 Tax=Bradyrhizobium sp. LHD-71 TaxID=3072141 RepID=UPI00280D13BC|nr:endo-1,4-beta-xylanase [Bradyrhizobium sp. LHD-71]MDQ8726381.1 endo-1,4-beta-xylanase [Bradyrhizobium sp. LHD-71]
MNSLHATAQTRGLTFGAAAGPRTITEPELCALVKQHCGIITTDIALKWNTVCPSGPSYDWTQADNMIAWAEAANIKVKGHPLVWNEFNPTWLWTDSKTAPDFGELTSPMTVDEAKRVFDQHITETIERFSGRIHIWDVVNEPIELAHGRDDGMRAKLWMKVWGPDYVARAFVRAHAADPHAKLFMNEQSLEKFNNEKARVKFLALIDRLLDAGVPIHGVGLESHLIMWAMVTHEGIMWLLNELHKRGLEVHISELDVAHVGDSGQGLPAGTDPATVDAAVASFVGSYLDDVLSFPNVTTVITWQLIDKYSWLYNSNPRPLPFDDCCQQKAFAREIERALISARPRARR